MANELTSLEKRTDGFVKTAPREVFCGIKALNNKNNKSKIQQVINAWKCIKQ